MHQITGFGHPKQKAAKFYFAGGGYRTLRILGLAIKIGKI
jgi:hypothetical protein